MRPYIYHIHHRQYMPHACTVIKQCPPVIVYETGTCMRGHLSVYQTMNIFWCSVSRRNSPNLWNRLQILCVMVLRRIVMYSCGVCWRGDLHSDGYVSSSTAAAHWVWLAHFTPHPQPQARALRHSASHSAGASPLLPLPLTLPHPEEKSRARSLQRSTPLIQLSDPSSWSEWSDSLFCWFQLLDNVWVHKNLTLHHSCFPGQILVTLNFKVQFSLLTNHSLLLLPQ